jgi:hypothetical protein
MKKVYKKLRTTRTALLLLLTGFLLLAANAGYSNNKIGRVEIGPQQGYVMPNDTGTVTYLITVYRDTAASASNVMNIGLCLRNEDGSNIFSNEYITASFEPENPFMDWGNNKQYQVTCTLKIKVNTPLPNNLPVHFGLRAWYPYSVDGCSLTEGDFAEDFSPVFQLGVPPQILCPTNITQNTDAGVCEATVNYSLTYVADAEASLTAGQYHGIPQPNIYYSLDGTNYSPGDGSGLVYPKGTTTVYLRASSGVGMDADCSFTVTVEDKQAPTLISSDKDCSSLNNIDLDWCLSAAAAFDAKTLEDDVAALYQDNCPGNIAVT